MWARRSRAWSCVWRVDVESTGLDGIDEGVHSGKDWRRSCIMQRRGGEKKGVDWNSSDVIYTHTESRVHYMGVKRLKENTLHHHPKSNV